MKKAFFQLHLSIVLAGMTGVLGRLISVNEGALVWFRMLITVVLLWLFATIRREHNQDLSRKSILRLFGIGGIIAVHWICFYGGIKYANVSVALVAFSTLGFFSAIIEPLVFKRRPDLVEILLGLIAVVGVALIFHFDTQYKKGIIFSIVSAFLGALFTVLNKTVMEKHEAPLVTRYEMTGGLIVVSLLLPFYFKTFDLGWQYPEGIDWLWLVILGWLCTVWAFNLSLQALKKISPFTINLSYNLEPVYGIILAFLIFHENKDLNLSFYLGLGLILLAVGLQMIRVSSSSLKRN